MRAILRVIVNSCEPTRRPVLTPLGGGGTRSQRISRQSRLWGTISGPEQEWGEGGSMRPTRSAVAASLHAVLRPGTRLQEYVCEENNQDPAQMERLIKDGVVTRK